MASQPDKVGDWHPLGNSFYRRVVVYKHMNWLNANYNLQDAIHIVGAPFAGPIAVSYLPAQDAASNSLTALHPRIDIFSSSGNLIGSKKWDSTQLLAIGWSSKEQLLCVQRDGTVLVYNMHNLDKAVYKFSFGSEAEKYEVLECEFFEYKVEIGFNSWQRETGIAVRTGLNKFYVIKNVYNPKVISAGRKLDQTPSCWCYVPAANAEIIFAADEHVYGVDVNTGRIEQLPVPWSNLKALTNVVLSPCTKKLAFLTCDGDFILVKSDLTECYKEFKTKEKSKPKQFIWCSSDAVAGFWSGANILIFVVCEKEVEKPWLSFRFENFVHLIAEDDGLRAISKYHHEFVHKVSHNLRAIFAIGSLESGTTLYDAYQHFKDNNHESAELLQSIKSSLELGVTQCINAAGSEFDSDRSAEMQKELLSAASFGKSFIDEAVPSHDLHKMCQKLRVLNAIKREHIGFPLTHKQLLCLSFRGLIDRLIYRRHFKLAVEVAKFLRIPNNEGSAHILGSWASYKVDQAASGRDARGNANVAVAIVDKLKDVPGVSFSDVADRALMANKEDIAKKLLEYEKSPYKQVPMLLKLDNEMRSDSALKTACESCDPSLMFEVVSKMHDKLKKSEFLFRLRPFPDAYQTYLKFLKQTDMETFRDYYNQEDAHYEMGLEKIKDSYRANTLAERSTQLAQAVEKFSLVRKTLKTLTDEQKRLLAWQKKFEEKFGKTYVDLSLLNTLKLLIEDKNYNDADALKKEFSIPEKLFWFIKLNALGATGNWEELSKFAARKSTWSNASFMVFETCVKHNNFIEAEKYLSKVDNANKVTAFLMLHRIDSARDFAFQKRDIEGLNKIVSHCKKINDPSKANEINLKIKQLTG